MSIPHCQATPNKKEPTQQAIIMRNV